MTQPLGDCIADAISEAMILQMGVDNQDEEWMLLTAMRLSGAPWSLVVDVYRRQIKPSERKQLFHEMENLSTTICR